MTAEHWMIALIPIAYLMGSIPCGFLVGQANGIDVRAAGSGNIGATNVGRLLGRRYFALVFALDVLKGLIPVAVAGLIIHSLEPRHVDSSHYALWLAVGAAAMLGHVFSLFLHFKGGKGVAIGLGITLGLFPYYTFAGLAALAVFLLLVKITRYMSVGSIGGATSVPLAYITIGLARGWDIFGTQWPLLGFGILMAVLVVIKHRANIQRIRLGTEYRIGQSRSPSPAGPT